MRALTLKQPWAELVVSGGKTVEVRSWATNHRGSLVIHAGSGKAEGYEELCIGLDAGAIVGVANVVDCRPLTPGDRVAAGDFDGCEWATEDCEGLFAWVLTDARRVRPIPMKGKLNLWHLPEGIVLQ